MGLVLIELASIDCDTGTDGKHRNRTFGQEPSGTGLVSTIMYRHKSRREFTKGLFSTFALSVLTRSSLAEEPLRVQGPRLLKHLTDLSRFGRTPEGGISRVAYSDADRDGRDYTMQLMRKAGLDVNIDFAGNIIGRLAGSDSNLPPLMFGSHIDSVPHGGNFDGQVGSMAAIEIAQTLKERGVITCHPLEVIIFQNEENGKTGSRAISGEVSGRELELTSHTEKTLGEGITFLGGNPDRIDEVIRKPGDVAAYLELHIEQGAILDQKGITIGVVEGIVGIKRWNVTVSGFANHAGTTPMAKRHDALLTAGRFIDAVNRVATLTPGQQVATVGRLTAHPGAPNVIPGHAQLSLEIRDLEMTKIDSVFQDIETESKSLGERNQTHIQFDQYYVSRAAPTEPRLQELVFKAAQALDYAQLSLPSGAGHDAQSIALLAPIGMIFIPSVDGISHSPKEFSRPEDVVAGADVLLHTLLALDRLSLG